MDRRISGKSKLRVLLGDNLLTEVQDREVIDFGCGAGTEAIELAKAGARRVTGVDIQTHQFPAALERARAEGVVDRVRFVERSDEPDRRDRVTRQFSSTSQIRSTSFA